LGMEKIKLKSLKWLTLLRRNSGIILKAMVIALDLLQLLISLKLRLRLLPIKLKLGKRQNNYAERQLIKH
ncbi:MAG: hypothetical protein IKW14_00110, partial [Phascolarctobacterium sp.]|nr:hypothetical protein [Phascolarctobacterium sp.]